MADRLDELKKELNSEPIEIKEIGESMDNDLLKQRQFELMIDIAAKRLEMKIDGLKEEILALKKEVERLKASKSEAPLPNSDTIKVPEDVQVEGFMQVKAPTRPVMSSTSEHAKSESPSVHPRLGNYKTEDVSVEKFFNFGRK